MKDNTPADEIFQSNSYKIICCPLIITHLVILTLPFSQKWCEDCKYRHKRLCAISPTAELQDMAELPKSASSFCTLQALAEILHTHLGWAHHSFSIQQIFAIQNKQTSKKTKLYKEWKCTESLSIKYWSAINLQLPHASLTNNFSSHKVEIYIFSRRHVLSSWFLEFTWQQQWHIL